LRAVDPGNEAPIPVDLVTASASGLDPEISLASAQYQMDRVGRARHMNVWQLQSLVSAHTQGRVLGLFGEPRVNVLELNLALDERQAHRGGVRPAAH
jgi:K+-transporting ATPase ATPase C chain